MSKPGEQDAPLGVYLGEFTTELKTDKLIIGFVSGGPQKYTPTRPTREMKCVK